MAKWGMCNIQAKECTQERVSRGSWDPVRREHGSCGQACRCVGNKLGQFWAGIGVKGVSSLLSRYILEPGAGLSM